jgi:hypothetical protein
MCNDYEQHIHWAQHCAMMQAAELGIPTHQNELDLPGADDIRINDLADARGRQHYRTCANEFQLSAIWTGRTSLQLQIRREAFPQK